MNAQDSIEEKQFELLKPMLFELNKQIFYENDYVSSETNPNYIPVWKKIIDLSNLDTIFNYMKKESSTELEEKF